MSQLPSTAIAIGGLRTTIHDLPDEILFNIGAQFTDLNRNRDLANLALVSSKWRIVAQEWLLKEPCFDIKFIYKYMWELGHKANLLGQVKRMEIRSTSEGRIHYNENGRTRQVYKPSEEPKGMETAFEFRDKCMAIVKYFFP